MLFRSRYPRISLFFLLSYLLILLVAHYCSAFCSDAISMYFLYLVYNLDAKRTSVGSGTAPNKSGQTDTLTKRSLLQLHILRTTMVSLHRTIRNLRRVGFKEWWRQLQYIGDAKSGTFIGADQYVASVLPLKPLPSLSSPDSETVILKTGMAKKRFQASFSLCLSWSSFIDQNSGRHRWVDFAQVCSLDFLRSMLSNAS